MLLGGKYQCRQQDIIGKGGFGTVFKVKNLLNNEFYALKFIRDGYDLIEEYEKEISLLKQFKNKYIIKLIDNFYDEKNKGYCLVMELCDGDLSQILNKIKPKGLPLNIIYKIFTQLNEALKEILNIGYVHRNLKPNNILIKYTDNNHTNFDIKLSSFKYSKYISDKIEEHSFVGTEAYMAPEIENYKYNNKCDLWSLGVLLYQLYTNKYIFEADNRGERMKNKYEGKIVKETDNEMINKLIRKLIQVDIDKRIKWEEYFNDEFFKNNNEKLTISFEDIYNKNEAINLKDSISCPICFNILISPVQCSICNKCFCKQCIEKYENSKNTCPFRCINPKYNENKFVNNILSILKFKCKNGCGKLISYDNLEKHYDEDCDKIDFKTKYKELLKKYKDLKTKYEK